MTSIHQVATSTFIPFQSQTFGEGWVDLFYEKHEKAYKEFDFATPLLDLIVEASCLKGLTLDEKKVWILAQHEKIVHRAYGDTIREEIALDCGPNLLEVLFSFIDRKGLFIQDPMLFYRYFSPNEKCEVDIEAFTDKLVEKMGDSISKKNPVPMFEVIYWMHFFYFRKEDAYLLAEKALNKFGFEEGSQVRALFIQMIPGIFRAFDAASNSYFSLAPQKSFAHKNSNSCIVL